MLSAELAVEHRGSSKFWVLSSELEDEECGMRNVECGIIWTGAGAGRAGQFDLVCLVYLVDLVHLVSFVQPNKRDKPNKPNKQGSLQPGPLQP